MKIKSLLATVVGVSTLAFSSAMWASLPLENRLSPELNTGSPAIGFTEVDILYKPGKTKKRGTTADTVFFAESSLSSIFTLIQPGDFVDVVGAGAAADWTGTSNDFLGDFILDAKISPKGTLKSGGTFGFWSLDDRFDSVGLTIRLQQAG